MTVQELRDVLDQAIEAGLGDVETRFAYQANYPLQDKIEGVWFDDDIENDEDGELRVDATFYLVSGGQDYDNPYAPRAAFENCTTEL